MTQHTVEALVQSLTQHNHAYRTGYPEISDAAYDQLTDELRSRAPDHPFLTSVEPEAPVYGKAKILHDTPMLSTDKAYSHAEVTAFVNRVLAAAHALSVPDDAVFFRITPKLDGMAAKDDGTQLVTRGNGIEGYDISHAVSRGLDMVGGRGMGIGEIVCSLPYYNEHLADEFDHPRSFMVGLISADTVDGAAKQALNDKAARFVPYSTLDAWEGNAKQLLEKLDAIEESIWQKRIYPLDGIVIETTHLAIKEYLGSTSHHHRWQLAKKPKAQFAETVVENIIWQVGRGKVTPVLEVTPVKVSGAVISRITAHHAGRVKADRLGVGAKISISRAGLVIPKYESLIEPAKVVSIPTHCPACTEQLAWKNDFLICENTAGCSGQHSAKLLHFFKTQGQTDGIGPAAADRLVENGITQIADVYALDKAGFMACGFGPGQAANLVHELARSRHQPLDDWRLLASMGIHDLGRGDSRKLLAVYPLTELATITWEEIITIPGFGEKTSRSIAAQLHQRWPEIQRLLDIGFNLRITPTADVLADIESPIAGKKIVFTGAMVSGSRSDLQHQARELGAETPSSVSKTTDYLVCGERVGQTKISKAESLGVTVLTEEQYQDLLAA